MNSKLLSSTSFPVVLFIVLYKMVLTLEPADEILHVSVTIQM